LVGFLNGKTDKIVKLLVSFLELSKDQALVLIYLIRNGKKTILEMSLDLKIEENRIIVAVEALLTNGMVFDLDGLKYNTFHPRFSIANCYRKNCEKKGLSLEKNVQIDALAAMLELLYESGRPK